LADSGGGGLYALPSGFDESKGSFSKKDTAIFLLVSGTEKSPGGRSGSEKSPGDDLLTLCGSG
jgi:hypothetical protein